VTGSGSSEHVNLSAVGGRVRLFRDVELVTLDMAGITAIGFQTGAGADAVTVNDLTGTGLADLDVDLGGDGQADRVTINGRPEADTVLAVPGPTPGRVDVIGLATAVRIGGADGPGDQLVVNGDAGGDQFTIDHVVTGATTVGFDGGAGHDHDITNGSQGADTFTVSSSPSAAGRVRVADGAGRFHEATAERIDVNALGGTDSITVGNDLAGVTDTVVDGGDGDDLLLGGNGEEILIGSAGADTARGGQGVDVALLGADDDTFLWAVGDGKDIFEGQAGEDTAVANGSAAPEDVDISAIGGRVRFVDSVGPGELDMSDVETFCYGAAGASDFIGVGQLSGTDLTTVILDLAAAPGGPVGDAGNDMLFVQATHGVDNVTVSGSAGIVSIVGLPARIEIGRAEFPNDFLQLHTLGGNDTVNTSGLAPNTISLEVL
jgi:hypothetical protein